MSDKRRCLDCRISIEKRHHNAKRCRRCAVKKLNRPDHNLTPSQQKRVVVLSKRHRIAAIAEKIGVSIPAVARFRCQAQISLRQARYSQETIDQVIECYELHGKAAVQKKFPEVNYRSIVERHPHAPRQARWKGRELVQVARMSGLVPRETQAKIFNRPRANAASIISALVKRLGVTSEAGLHGLPHHTAMAIVDPLCPSVMRPSTTRPGYKRRLYLWCDIAHNMLPGTPMYLRQGIRAMHKFQQWLYKTDDPRRAILRIMGRA